MNLYKHVMIVISLIFIPHFCFGDALQSSIRTSVSAMRAQSIRLKVISQNIANSEVTGKNPKDDPYRRKQVVFSNYFDEDLQANLVNAEKITPDKSEFVLKYEPHHPAADNDGYVKYPNVNIIVETVDAKEAQRSFEANLSAMEIAKNNQARIIELMR